jgi:hypothetical protein
MVAALLLLPVLCRGQLTVDGIISADTSQFNYVQGSAGGYWADPRDDQQTGHYQDDFVGNATNNPGFMMNVATFDAGTSAGVLDYMVIRVRFNEYDSKGYDNQGKLRFGIDVDGDNAVDLYFGVDSTQHSPPSLGFQDPGDDLNISPNTSSIGDNFIPQFEVGDLLYGLSESEISALMTLTDGSTFSYMQATAGNSPGTNFAEFAGKKANTPDSDAYLTFAVPILLLSEAIQEFNPDINFTVDSYLQLIAFTATQNNTVNQDLYGVDGINGSVDYSNGAFSAWMRTDGTVPEPSTVVQLSAFALVALLIYRRRLHSRPSNS